VASPLEKAKQVLESMDHPDLAAVYADDSIGKMLAPEDKKPLLNFFFYLKLKRKRQEEEDAKK
jgi:hypothetical protein